MSWLSDDQDKAIAWLAVDRDACPQCGTQSWEQDDFEPKLQTCRACANVQNFAADQLHDGHPPKKPGKSVVLVRKGRNGE